MAEKEWHIEAKKLAESMPIRQGIFRNILRQMQSKYPELSYDAVRLYLRKEGFKTGNRPRINYKKQVRLGDNSEYFGIAKFNSADEKISNVCLITKEEANFLIEKRKI